MSIFLRAKNFVWILVLLITIWFMLGSGIIGKAHSEEMSLEKTSLKVTILIYSGRPNPTYLLEDKSAMNRLKVLVNEAKPNERFEKATVIPSILGYNGITIDNPAKIPGFPAHIAVYRGNIEAQDENKRFLIDEGGAIESLLIDQALEKGVIDEGVLKFIKSR